MEEESLTEVEEEGREKESNTGVVADSRRDRERKVEFIEWENDFGKEEKREILNRRLERGERRRRGGRRMIDGRDADVRRGEDEEEGGFELSREE